MTDNIKFLYIPVLWGWRRAYKGIITCGNAEGDFHTNMGSIFKK